MLLSKVNLSKSLFVATVICCTIAEMILLEIKYVMFTGGFNQVNQLVTLGDRALFIGLFFIFNIIFYGLLFKIWKKILNKTKLTDTVIAFHFLMISGIITAISLVVQFELHKYFADAMDISLMTNLAGGDLTTAILYAADEALFVVLGLFILIVVYYIFFKFFKNYLEKHGSIDRASSNKPIFFKKLGLAVAGLIIIIISVNMIGRVDKIYSSLMKTNSYSMIVSLLDKASDFDGDGYGNYKKPVDVNLFDDSISPGALDILGNSIDEDGYFGDFNNFIKPSKFIIKPLNGHKVKHVITIVMESTRADVIGKKIDNVLVAPHITALAKEGVSIEQSYSHTGFTATSLRSLFTGVIGTPILEDSIFVTLHNQGYDISIFSTQDETWGGNDVKLGMRKVSKFFYDAQTGVDKRVYASKRPVSIRLNEKTIWEEFKKFSDDISWEKPQFIYFNMQAAHFPYYYNQMAHKFIKKGISKSDIKIENKDWINRTYWNALNHADIYVGKIINELKMKGVWEDTLLIITADHGEDLFDDRYLGHGFLMNETQTRVPLIISQKDFKFNEPVGHSDVKNLILNYLFSKNNDQNTKTDRKEKVVFQLIGGLEKPAKISLKFYGKKQISFDMKNMLVRGRGKLNWIPYNKALKDDEIKLDLKQLIFHWENLRWQNHLVKNQK